MSTLRFIAVCAALACGCRPVEADPVELRTLESGRYRLTADTTPALSLARDDGTVLLELGRDGIELGLVDSVDDVTNYDPLRFYVPHALYQPPESLRWVAMRPSRFLPDEDGAVGIELLFAPDDAAVARASAKLRIEANEGGSFSLSLVAGDPRVAYIRLRPRVDAAEGLYGLGEQFDSPDNRGHVRPMQIEIDPTIESSYNEAHVPIPLLLGSRGWGLFVESLRPGVFAVAHERADRVEASFGTGTSSRDEGLRFHLFGAEHPLDLLRPYYELTGYPALPARWALGPWIWRDETPGQEAVEADLDAIRDFDLATTGYWIDRPYASGVNTFDFEPASYADPQAMLDKARALGLRTALWHTPYLDEEDRSTEALRELAEASGYYPPVFGIQANQWGTALDLTNPEAVAWWQSLLDGYRDMGIEGYKLDYAEDVLVGLTSARNEWRFADGSDERTMQRLYQRFYHDTYRALLPDDGGFLLCRSSVYGDQQNGLVIWPGDLDATFGRHREPAEKDGDSWVGVGGLPAAVSAGLSLSASGLPFFGSDTGGYKHCPPDKELFMRWAEHTALSTVMQVGGSCNDVPWESTRENGFDEELLDSYRFYARLHLRLFPYLWSHAVRMRDDGRPIQRPFGLAHPELGVHPNDQYLLGDALLVAPVIERDARERRVFFPAGGWVHWLTGERFEGPGEMTVAAPLDSLPLFLRDGGLVPMLRPTIDSLSPTTEPARVDSYASDAGVLYVRAVFATDGSFELFDGGRVAQRIDGAVVVLESSSGSELEQGALFELVRASAPAAVTILDRAAPELASLDELATAATGGWLFDGDTLWVRLPAGGGAEARITQ